ADVACRHPVFRKANDLTGLKERIGLLVAKQSSLYFEIAAVVVGESFPPVEAVGVNTPGPYLLRRHFVVGGKVHRTCIRVRVPDAHEIFATSMSEHRNRTFLVISENAVIDAVIIDRPSVHFGESMRGRKSHGILDARVVPGLNSCVVPPVEAMAHITAV